MKDVDLSRGKTIRTLVLRCTIIHEDKTPSTPCYALADSRERGAVFVFLPKKDQDKLELYARVTKIGALLNPVGPKEVK